MAKKKLIQETESSVTVEIIKEEEILTPVESIDTVAVINSTPPIADAFERNEYGLLKKINYIFNEDGSINWRKMIKPEYLIFNDQRIEEMEKEYKKPASELKVTEVDDKYLLILLAGIKELAALRGFRRVTYEVKPVTDDFVVSKCSILWNKNYETNDSIIFEDAADATLRNTNGIAREYLTTIAVNRSFVRAVRNFLKIYIVGYDEIVKSVGASFTEENTVSVNTDPNSVLTSLMEKHGITFEKLKEICGSKGDDVSKWNSITDIPKSKIFELNGRISKME